MLWVNTSNDFFQRDFQLHPWQSFWNQWHSCAVDWEKPGSASPSRIPTAQRLNLCTTLLGWWWYMAAFRLVRDIFNNDEANMMVRCRWSVNSRNGSKSSWRTYLASVLSWCLWCTSCGRRCLRCLSMCDASDVDANAFGIIGGRASAFVSFVFSDGHWSDTA